MHSRRPLFVLVLLLLLFPAVSRSQQMTLELEPGATSLGFCDTGHRILTCDTYHIETVSAATVGGTLELNDQPYTIDKLGPGYYLDSGVILELLGNLKPDLVGQGWTEVYPHEGNIHVSTAWTDSDHSGSLSVSDSLTLEDGRALRILDVRLLLRVSPLKP
ncbi:MAG: hypothetical protein WAM82_06920 [Thermoanaerobaculia bacterium]